MSPLPGPAVRPLPADLAARIRSFLARDRRAVSLVVVDGADFVAVARGTGDDLLVLGRYSSDSAADAALRAYHGTVGLRLSSAGGSR